jgi:hypothetical protein
MKREQFRLSEYICGALSQWDRNKKGIRMGLKVELMKQKGLLYTGSIRTSHVSSSICSHEDQDTVPANTCGLHLHHHSVPVSNCFIIPISSW